MRTFLTYILLSIITLSASAGVKVHGVIKCSNTNESIEYAQVIIQELNLSVFTGEDGSYIFEDVESGNYTLIVSSFGKEHIQKTIKVGTKALELNYALVDLNIIMDDIVINRKKLEQFTESGKIALIDGTTINPGKTETIDVDKSISNKATNNARSTFSHTAGVHVWENDGAGIQLGIGGRGLSPSRVSNFNTRQNGYDISADALGYPESYYSPSIEAVDKIEIVRGAASLQYGTQFGGFLNFKMKRGNEQKKAEVVSRQSMGSWNFFNSFNSVGGQVGKVNYYTFVQRKQGDGWRPNSEFAVNMAFAGIEYAATKKFKIGLEYTYMDYIAKQAGGLTDRQFAVDPRQSNRERNWFKVNWNLFALKLDYEINNSAKISMTNFGLLAGRDALGFLGPINRTDPGGDRNLLTDDFKNYGSEVRFLQKHKLFGISSAFQIGARFYKGFTDRKQGFASSASDADFTYLNANDPGQSNFDFPSQNIAIFTQNVISVTDKFKVIPGVRFEHIDTKSNGYYNVKHTDLAGNVIFEDQVQDDRDNSRSFFLFGIGFNWFATDRLEIYGNASQNYRSINFNDMRVVNPNFRVDQDLKDETGFTVDFGTRGKLNKFIYFDANLFFLKYDDRIGNVIQTDSTLFTTYTLRTNISDSRTYGIESLVEVDFYKWLINPESTTKLAWFGNFSWMDAIYLDSDEAAFDGKKVELVPSMLLKTGVSFAHNGFGISYQFSFTEEHYTDATNAESTANSVNGLIPSYSVMDLNLSYEYKRFKLEGSINNLTNATYFTKRAEGYPGPGIIPSDGRGFYLTLQVKI